MPKIVGKSLADHRAMVRANIFEAFAELMGEHSFEAISMSALAERAGIGRTAIYHHFPDREAVLIAFASYSTESYLSDLREAIGDQDEPGEMLRTYVHHHLTAGEKFHMGLGPSLAGSLSAEARLEMREHIRAVEDVLRRILEAGQTTGAFDINDVDASMSLIHACLSPRHLPPAAIEEFVLRAVGAGGLGVRHSVTTTS